MRRSYCEHPACEKVTFAEQVEGLTRRYQRGTPALQKVVDAVAVALAGPAGARLLSVLHHILGKRAELCACRECHPRSSRAFSVLRQDEHSCCFVSPT
ncbi:hypothetical protein [Streptomyces silvisoli]|uniref:Uncharacterized protein n=1 Tax=Streptomyces silvisoli TaxID=3034235 RepID=A0ABT5ZXH7_9ACTN|nr:hypothetical protein [Streptomyces silvisoli]MDF3294351.1 hypothetical protein [Streptomyces silvisoli]